MGLADISDDLRPGAGPRGPLGGPLGISRAAQVYLTGSIGRLGMEFFKLQDLVIR